MKNPLRSWWEKHKENIMRIANETAAKQFNASNKVLNWRKKKK